MVFSKESKPRTNWGSLVSLRYQFQHSVSASWRAFLTHLDYSYGFNSWLEMSCQGLGREVIFNSPDSLFWVEVRAYENELRCVCVSAVCLCRCACVHTVYWSVPASTVNFTSASETLPASGAVNSSVQPQTSLATTASSTLISFATSEATLQPFFH